MNGDPKASEFRDNPVWAAIIPDPQWSVYLDAIRATRKTGARFLLGGAFGLAAYTGRWRNTKDLDFFVLPTDKDRIIDALTKAGFEDFYPRLAYDRGWIYRAVRDDTIVDTIWQTPNRRTVVDEQWFTRSYKVILRGENLHALPAEELLAIKLYVLQRDRCDWPDLINLLHQTCDQLDWKHLLDRLGDDRPLLGGLLHVFNWVAPSKAIWLPAGIRELFHLAEITGGDLGMPEDQRVTLLDSRPWYAAFQPTNKPMLL